MTHQSGKNTGREQREDEEGQADLYPFLFQWLQKGWGGSVILLWKGKNYEVGA